MIFSNKTLGLEIRQDGARMVLVEGKPQAPRLESYSATTFPPDTCRLSFREENVVNPSLFVAKIRETYLRLLTTISRVSVALPDAAGRVVVLDMETRFKSRAEGSDMIRWKIKKNFPFDVSELNLDYQVLREKATGEISVLVSLISRKVIRQYENLLEEAGLQPNLIDFTTFGMCQLFAGRLEVAENSALILWHGGTLGVLIFYDGLLEFYRSKEIAVQLQGANRIFHEINSSLLVFKDKHPGFSINDVFCIVPQDDAHQFRAVITEATGVEPVLLDAGRCIFKKEGFALNGAALQDLAGALGAAIRNL